MSGLLQGVPDERLARIGLVGPMGIGKTTALRSLCGDLLAGTDVPNLDRASHGKAFTTVGTEFGEIDLGDGERLQLVGSPGQERFHFVRQWVLQTCAGVLLMVDIHDPAAVQYTARQLREIAQLEADPVVIVLSCRACRDPLAESFCTALAEAGHGAVPVVQADPRERGQLLDALSVLVSLLSLQRQI